MEQMLEQGCFSDPVQRIGAEQELVIVDGDWQPAPLAMGLLEDLDDPRVTTEIAKFNLEANLPPLEFTGDCLARMEAELNDVIAVIRRACHARGAEVILTGILPTLVKGHLSRENIADRPRYFELDKALLDLRGGAYELKIKGTDEVSIETDSVILEGAQHELPDPLPGAAGDVRGALQPRPGDRRPRARRRGEQPGAVRQAAVAGDADRDLPAGGGHPPRCPRRARHPRPGALRRGLGQPLRAGAVQERHRALPRDPRARGGRGSVRGDRIRAPAAAPGAAVAQFDRLPVESGVLRRAGAAPADREPDPAGGPHRRRRGGQRRLLVRPHARRARRVGGSEALPGLRRGACELRDRRPRGAPRGVQLDEQPLPLGAGSHRRGDAAGGPGGARCGGGRCGGSRPAARHHRRSRRVAPHRGAVAAALGGEHARRGHAGGATRLAHRGHRRAAAS